MSKVRKPFYQRMWFIILAALIGVSAFGSLINPDDNTLSNDSSRNENSSDSSKQDSQETFKSYGCLAISEYLLDSIGQGLKNSVPTGKAAAYKAADYQDVKFIAIEFLPNGTTDNLVAVFATNDDNLTDSRLDGLIIAVDGFAREFSDWATELNTDLSFADREAQESIDCLDLPGASLENLTSGPADFDEEEFLKNAKSIYGVVDETFEDGSVLTVMQLARTICESDVSTAKKNLGQDWNTSFNKFAIESLCPEKLK